MITVRVEKTAAEQKIERDWLVNISTTGEVIAEEYSKLCKFSLQQDGSYSETWRHLCPGNIGRVHRKYLTDSGDVILQNTLPLENPTTFVFDQDMKVKDSWQYQGDLIACLPGPRTVYAVRDLKGMHSHHVEINKQNGEVLQLIPERKAWNSKGLCVCEDWRTGKLAVVECPSSNSSVDIFSRVGKTKQRIHHQIIMQLLSPEVKPGTHILENNNIIGVFTMLKLCVSKVRLAQ